MDGRVPSTDYYRFNVTADKTYAVSIQYSGDQAPGSSYTASTIYASAYWEDNPSSYLITEELFYAPYYDTKWYTTPQTFTPLSSGNIIIGIGPYFSGDGTYGVMIQEAPAFYSVSANGSSSNTSSQLTLTFDEPVTGLTLDDITVSGGYAVKKSGVALTGSGTTWYVPITVTSASVGSYSASVTVSHAGVHAAAHPVSVYKALPNYTLSANGTSGVTASTLLTLVFDEPVTGLTWSEIDVNGAAGKSGASLTGSGITWYLPITTAAQGTAYVTVNHTGVNSSSHSVSVYDVTPTTSGISNISYTPVSGGSWTSPGDGWYQSPSIGHNETTKIRVNFTSTGTNAELVITLGVSSESGYDWAFIGYLDTWASTSSNYVQISGEDWQTVTITVPSAGSHYVEIGYGKDSSATGGSDCAWFKID
jgi:hypothetical protein